MTVMPVQTALPDDYGVATAADTIRFERLLPGPIERVWAYLIEPDKRGSWLASGELAPRVGGAVRLRFRHASLSRETAPAPERFRKFESGHVSHHRVTRFAAPHLLSLTWSQSVGSLSEVDFELTPEDKQVRFVLIHRQLADRAAMVSIAAGWHIHLDILVVRLKGREPRPFWTAFADLDGVYEQRLAV